MNIISWFYSRIALALYPTRRVTSGHLPQLYRTVERLTRRAGLHMPKIYLIPNDSPNALATGRNPSHASVAVSQGLLNPPSDEELVACWNANLSFGERETHQYSSAGHLNAGEHEI